MPRTCRCPHCGCDIPDDVLGRSVACPDCKKPVEPGEQRVAAGPLGRRDPPPPTDPSRDDHEREHRRTRAGRQRGSSGALVLVLALAGAGVAWMFCLASIGGVVGYLLLASREAANDRRAAARAAEKPPAPPAGTKPLPDIGPDIAPPAGKKPPPDIAPPPVPRPPTEPQAEFPPATPSARADELIRNGDFEQGLKGFRTAYRHSPGNIRHDCTFCRAQPTRRARRRVGIQRPHKRQRADDVCQRRQRRRQGVVGPDGRDRTGDGIHRQSLAGFLVPYLACRIWKCASTARSLGGWSRQPAAASGRNSPRPGDPARTGRRPSKSSI